jgi:hypothetical protein
MVLIVAAAFDRRRNHSPSCNRSGWFNKRVLIRTGLVSRRSVEVLLPKVESIGKNETLAGRILGYGTVVVRGTGGTCETFEKIREPKEFRRHVQSQLSGEL